MVREEALGVEALAKLRGMFKHSAILSKEPTASAPITIPTA